MKSLFIALFFIVCIEESRAQESYLLVTSGGGVAGTATVYKIGADGKVMRGKGLGEINYTDEAKINRCATKKYFKRTKALMKSSPDFNHPGNLYSSIILYDQGKESKVTWGDAAHAAPEDAKKLYQKINAKLTRLTFTPEAGK